ncbi:MAG: type II 3-dehydroquinate dehydratase [Deltaproteobacteria bacterium RIFCSPLOWO2_12_FULL_40_28]|nr:MAG: type II 3-dehydroquinate dehydratase [Deltaproteobacteria bacterium RIFCSPHIGHO2_02_FULL_40_28]OGQ20410.1 MAG: type II 3-dehydroquinate dehydratase [Deltaproteobacteria bacterium RIFCSPHIGHO2_12_FULL_40_32]OGQ41379.1 MAG: type II 3-dehydroquinate dehydratase [Deltaproteobacteria bacterium RIFCSPLOWO2_02_FULL_40_36]OGQ55018.1 MAG: type II 3-dehydroquinate dehydratase [Deltaproteobacteria bacterium RIFCSPLOWO2_12_FULL_40_28]
MAKKKKKILVIHGPNLNLLGVRETSVYGKTTLDEINKNLKKTAKQLEVTLEIYQSNSEGDLVKKIQESMGPCDGILINPAAYTHTSVAIRDAVSAINLPVVEVHLSNIYQREEFRHHSFVSGVALGQIAGFGPNSYTLGLKALVDYLNLAG